MIALRSQVVNEGWSGKQEHARRFLQQSSDFGCLKAREQPKILNRFAFRIPAAKCLRRPRPAQPNLPGTVFQQTFHTRRHNLGDSVE